MKPNIKRLKEVVRANEGRDPKSFDMNYVSHVQGENCGTAACMLGGYIQLGRQRAFKREASICSSVQFHDGSYEVFDSERVREHFGLTERQFDHLFAPFNERDDNGDYLDDDHHASGYTLRFMLNRFRKFITKHERTQDASRESRKALVA